MPFNRVSNIKSTVMFLLLLNERKETEVRELDGQQLLKTNNIPCYVPGLMLIPIPEAGFIAGHVDMAFWAVFLYVLGSITYCIDSFYLWGLTYDNYSDDALNPSNYWNTLSAALFVLNALICFWDWYLQEQQLSVTNMSRNENLKLTGGLQIEEVPHRLSVYYFYNNLFFLAAAMIYLVQSMWSEDGRTDSTHCADAHCGSFWINFWGSMCYFLSSAFSVLECRENQRLRDLEGLPPLEFFTFDMHKMDWFGWGDWLYLIISVQALFQTFLYSFITSDDDVIAPYYLSENFMFLFDSLAYFIGYMLFIWDLRQALITGYMHKSQLGAVSSLVGDNYEGAEGEGTLEAVQSHPLFVGGRDSISLSDIRRSLNEAKSIRERRTSESIARQSQASLPSTRNTISSFELASLGTNSERGSPYPAKLSSANGSTCLAPVSEEGSRTSSRASF